MAHKYVVVAIGRDGTEREHEYSSQEELRLGDVINLKGRWWLLERIEPPRAFAQPARYRLTLRHPDGREEVGGFRRHRPDGPKLGHSFTTLEEGQPISWQVVDAQLAHDAEGAYLSLIAERDYGEAEGDIPDHELEHALARREAEELPEAAVATLGRAEQAGLAVELAALDPGEEPDWTNGEEFIDALILEEIEDDLLEQCRINTLRDPQETWLDTVKARLRSDLGKLRADVEGEHEEIEEWDFLGGRIFASVGSVEDESDPDKGHGWMCRLIDSDALGAAGFERVRKADLF